MYLFLILKSYLQAIILVTYIFNTSDVEYFLRNITKYQPTFNIHHHIRNLPLTSFRTILVGRKAF